MNSHPSELPVKSENSQPPKSKDAAENSNKEQKIVEKEVTQPAAMKVDLVDPSPRVYKTANNCMNSWVNFSFVIPMVAAIRKKDREEAEKAKKKAPPPPSHPPPPNAKRIAEYSRYTQESFGNDTDEFQIQTGMSFRSSPVDLPTEKKSKTPTESQNQLKRAKPSDSSVKSQQPEPKKKRTQKNPIIIIPAGGKALISLFNAEDILQEYKFVSTEDKKKSNCKREKELIIHHLKTDGQTIPYRITENPERLTDEEWNRVVAVFVLGPAWQFKGWKWNGNPTDIFANVAAFHLKYEEATLDPNVAKWDVTVLPISRHKRHLDRIIFKKVWERIEQFIARHKPDIRY